MTNVFLSTLDLTVGELKAALDKFPDETPIYAEGDVVPEEKDFNSIRLSLSTSPGTTSLLFLTVGMSY